MSMDSLVWALSANPGNASRKLVLISLADRADEQLECYPSSERLERDTCLNLKTVKKCLRELAEAGYIEDTGRRVGQTRRVVVWRLLGVELREQKAQQEAKKNRPKNGSVKSTQKRNDTKNGINPDFPENEPKNGTIESTQKRVAEPPIVLTTQVNHPDSCADLAEASSSPADENPSNESGSVEGELVTQDSYTGAYAEVVPGWTFAQLIDPPSADDDTVFIALPLRADQSPPVHLVRDLDVVNLQSLYPSLDVPGELRSMLGWCYSHANERKLHAGIKKFITGWLNRSKAKGSNPWSSSLPHLTEYEKCGAPDRKTQKERVRSALRDIQNTQW